MPSHEATVDRLVRFIDKTRLKTGRTAGILPLKKITFCNYTTNSAKEIPEYFKSIVLVLPVKMKTVGRVYCPSV